MKEPIEVKLQIEKEDYNKLLQLAGSESALSDYIAKLTRRLHRERTIFGENLPIDQIYSSAEELEHKAHGYEQMVHTLQERLKHMTMRQEELMATVDYLRTLSSQICQRATEHRTH